MKGNWGGIGTTPIQCPSWAILSLDHMGREKKPCCIGSADSKSLKPICEDCGLGCYLCLLLMELPDEHTSVIIRRCG
jgi:Fe-coproporphyrin III synthase